MVQAYAHRSRPLEEAALRAMFEARKRVFVDLLKWDVPVVDGCYEMGEFDDIHAVYLLVTDPDGRHLGSARLLKTTRPHILGTLFPDLCEEDPPAEPGTLEITRFCLDRRQTAAERLQTRNLLVSALVQYAIANGIAAYCAVAEMGWLQQILSFGWICRPLGLPRRFGGHFLGAITIEISTATPLLLHASGIYRSDSITPASLRTAA